MTLSGFLWFGLVWMGAAIVFAATWSIWRHFTRPRDNDYEWTSERGW